MAKQDLRSDETAAKYLDFRNAGGLDDGCVICKKDSLAEFTYWRIVENSFPYDRIATTHHMLVPYRHEAEAQLPHGAQQELQTLKSSYLSDHYDIIIEALPGNKSVPAHHHYHIIVQKEA